MKIGGASQVLPICIRIENKGAKTVSIQEAGVCEGGVHVALFDVPIEVEDDGGETIGMMQTYKRTDECFEGRSYKYSFKMDCSNLVEGEYSFFVDVFVDNDKGVHFSVDHPMEPIRFRIYDDNPTGLIWHSNYGSIRLNPIEIISGEQVANL